MHKWIECQFKDFPTFVEQRVFGPLHMDQSGYARTSKSTQGHDENGKPIDGGARIYPECAAAGAWTTPEDLTKLVIEIQKAYRGEGTVLSHETAKKMLEQTKGLGVAVPPVEGARYFFHSGENHGFRCMVIGNTAGQGAVIMSNSDNGKALCDEILARITEIYQWDKAELVDIFEPLMDLQEAKSVDRKAWSQCSQGVYLDREAPPIEKVEFHIRASDEGKIMGHFEITQGGAKTTEDSFELIPVSATRACFRRSEKAPYEFVDVNNGRVSFSFGGDFHK